MKRAIDARNDGAKIGTIVGVAIDQKQILAMVKRYSHLVVGHRATVIERMITAKGL